jgi:hypothetical protein
MGVAPFAKLRLRDRPDRAKKSNVGVPRDTAINVALPEIDDRILSRDPSFDRGSFVPATGAPVSPMTRRQ